MARTDEHVRKLAAIGCTAQPGDLRARSRECGDSQDEDKETRRVHGFFPGNE